MDSTRLQITIRTKKTIKDVDDDNIGYFKFRLLKRRTGLYRIFYSYFLLAKQ